MMMRAICSVLVFFSLIAGSHSAELSRASVYRALIVDLGGDGTNLTKQQFVQRVVARKQLACETLTKGLESWGLFKIDCTNPPAQFVARLRRVAASTFDTYFGPARTGRRVAKTRPKVTKNQVGDFLRHKLRLAGKKGAQSIAVKDLLSADAKKSTRRSKEDRERKGPGISSGQHIGKGQACRFVEA